MKIVAVRYRNVFLFSAVVFLLFLAYEFLIAGAEEPLELVQGVKDLGTFCSKVAEDCYFVKQEVKRDKSVLRYIESEKYSRDGMFKMTIVPLEVESNKVVINRKSLSSQYISVMATFPYAIGALRFDAPGQKVLSIGLGGGSLDMFLRITRPELDITVVELDPTILEMATRWFGVVEDEKRRTIVADGNDFLEKAALKGDTFDVIALDACNSGASTGVPRLHSTPRKRWRTRRKR
ncbi:hypothetical protein L596_015898 [Steinernema carpocapsae]|uniref:PABS domain-containing protein n=1 Tax=Steinernema carpocapsae TaxID=34508 RepID=A0A4V6A383_STECR|nr:hypothetical protein L596_015898 [Steinernema carpocapsae]